MMKTTNILILSAGRRVELIERFKAAKERLGYNGKIIAVDISETAPALYFSDSFYLIPRISEQGYIDAIIDVCSREQIDLIVPTIDTELSVLDCNREYIEKQTKAKILLSRHEVIELCGNKKQTQNFFEANGFGVPMEFRKKEIEKGTFTFPLFIKPQEGSSSINTFKIHNREELLFFINYIEKPIIQEFIDGKEFSVDVFCDFDGNAISIVPRNRLATRGGEILKGKTIKDREIIDDVKRLISVLKPIGPVTIQCMKTNQDIRYIEINPRYGGGVPMSIDAGADSCEFLYRLLNGETLTYTEEYDDGAVFVRFDNSIRIDTLETDG